MDRTCKNDGVTSEIRLPRDYGFQLGPALSLFCSEGRQVLCCELPRGEVHMKSLAYSQGDLRLPAARCVSSEADPPPHKPLMNEALQPWEGSEQEASGCPVPGLLTHRN